MANQLNIGASHAHPVTHAPRVRVVATGTDSVRIHLAGGRQAQRFLRNLGLRLASLYGLCLLDAALALRPVAASCEMNDCDSNECPGSEHEEWQLVE